MFVLNRFGKCFEIQDNIEIEQEILKKWTCKIFKDKNELYLKTKKVYVGINKYLIQKGRTEGFFSCYNGRDLTIINPNTDTLEEFLAYYM